ncbi:uncharacterized protein [Physcomitrium patens]
MGDTDARVRAVAPLDSGDSAGAAAPRALMEGGSLPPRKRLLAGLKQNGWLPTSPPPAVSASAGGGHAVGVGSEGAGVGGEGMGRKLEDGGCMGCSVVESDGMRRIKRGGVSLRLCSACAVLYSKSMFCPHCLAMYHDASLLGDPSMWLVCSRCRRSVHPECEQKASGAMADTASYVCVDCVNTARRHREANGVTGARSRPSGAGRAGGHHHHGEARAGGSGGAGVVVGLEGLSPALKKPRMMRHPDSSRFERQRSGAGTDAAGEGRAGSMVAPRKVASPGQVQLEGRSPQEAAVAARSAAATAAKVAAAAKANAAAKASAAVKAAAAAKAALEAAAHACRAEAACRAELRRKVANANENRSGGGGGGRGMRLEINVHSEPRRERSSKGEVKYEVEEGYGGRRGGAGSVDDGELARQLHRVINSSPRISRSMTPLRRKASVKPETPSSGVSSSSTEAVRSRPRGAEGTQVVHGKGPSPNSQEQHGHGHGHGHVQGQFRQQQTRPRSITHKELRRIDSRASRDEVKMAEEGKGGANVNVNVNANVGAGPGARVDVGEGGVMAMEGLEASGNADADAEAIANAVEESMQQREAGGEGKEEAMEGVEMEFGGVGVADEASMLFDALVAADEGGMEGGSVGADGRRPDYLQEILEAAVLTDTAMSFNEGGHVGMSDAETMGAEGGAGVGEEAGHEHGHGHGEELEQGAVGASGLGDVGDGDGDGVRGGYGVGEGEGEGEGGAAEVERGAGEGMSLEVEGVAGGGSSVAEGVAVGKEESSTSTVVDDAEMREGAGSEGGGVGEEGGGGGEEEGGVGPSSMSEVGSEAVSVVQEDCASGRGVAGDVGVAGAGLVAADERREGGLAGTFIASVDVV